jgi:hypothetical protein
MNGQPIAQAYLKLLETGPFPDRIDPWSEIGHYFHQLHASMIGVMIERLRLPLLERGYVASREASLQIADQGEPDVAVYEHEPVPAPPYFDYGAVATALQVNPGVAVNWNMPDIDAMFVHALDGGLVTVVEIISPSNKADRSRQAIYKQRRLALLEDQGVNVVELDLTRSVTHLFITPLADAHPYHIAIYLPHAPAWLIGMVLDQPLARFALPLKRDGLVVETHDIYREAYRQVSIAVQLRKDQRYTAAALPFPSLLTDAERQVCVDAVATWERELARVKGL